MRGLNCGICKATFNVCISLHINDKLKSENSSDEACSMSHKHKYITKEADMIVRASKTLKRAIMSKHTYVQSMHLQKSSTREQLKGKSYDRWLFASLCSFELKKKAAGESIATLLIFLKFLIFFTNLLHNLYDFVAFLVFSFAFVLYLSLECPFFFGIQKEFSSDPSVYGPP